MSDSRHHWSACAWWRCIFFIIITLMRKAVVVCVREETLTVWTEHNRVCVCTCVCEFQHIWAAFGFSLYFQFCLVATLRFKCGVVFILDEREHLPVPAAPPGRSPTCVSTFVSIIWTDHSYSLPLTLKYAGFRVQPSLLSLRVAGGTSWFIDKVNSLWMRPKL